MSNSPIQTPKEKTTPAPQGDSLHQPRPATPRFRSRAILLLLPMALALLQLTSCHPGYTKKIAPYHSVDTTQNAELALQYPLTEWHESERKILLRHSQPTNKVLVPDGQHQQGLYHHGKIELILEEIDGEPNYFRGHPPGTDTDSSVSLIIYGIRTKQLDQLVPGDTYIVHWIETVVNTQPFDDDRYRQFLTYRIEGKRD